MLRLTEVAKVYKAGQMTVNALDGVSLSFQPGEFVAVLGPSGCGKTTLLNLIGGLDRADGGDISVFGRSIRGWTDREMDAYRNHSVGFVFQNYNLIAHQSVLANVELSLTLSGVGAQERKRRAREALLAVGLPEQAGKRPNQLSGGQMQRVAIARALVNDPDILLLDEPTGALDTQTSVQVLDVLKNLAKDRLVIMVTHNRELAEQYATRIIRLRDGKVAGDSAPAPEKPKQEPSVRTGRTSMGFSTALSLSLNNLLTKRGRTLITAFAGSIGIIGIALILALSTGVNRYIADIQRDTMASYPIVIQSEAVEMDGMMEAFRESGPGERQHPLDAVYPDNRMLGAMSGYSAGYVKNDLKAFKSYLEGEGNLLSPYLSEVRYEYEPRFDLYATDPEGELVNAAGTGGPGMPEAFSAMLPFSDSVMFELNPSSADGLVGESALDRYELLAGSWPGSAEEVMLVLDKDNELPDLALFNLGLLPQSELRAFMRVEPAAPEAGQRRWEFEDLLGRPFSLLTYSDYFARDAQGLYGDVRGDETALRLLIADAPRVAVSGIARAKDDGGFVPSGLGYTRALADKAIRRAQDSPAVIAQRQSPDANVVNGLPFQAGDDAQKAGLVQGYVARLDEEEKTDFARRALRLLPGMLPGSDKEPGGAAQPEGMSGSAFSALLRSFAGTGGLEETDKSAPGDPWSQAPQWSLEALGATGASQTAGLLDAFLSSAGDAQLARVYDALVAPMAGSLETALDGLGVTDLAQPSSIALYTDSFGDKEKVSELLEEYNAGAGEGGKIVYTDYVAMMISSVTTIVNVISYVLIAFVAVSLVVSSIMIGIITYISVLERIQEIGILRALGASRKDVGRVFTAEAFIIGLAAGILGIAVSALLTLPINAVIHRLTDNAGVNAVLPVIGAIALVGISALLSLMAGFIPSRVAARKHPVEALRSE